MPEGICLTVPSGLQLLIQLCAVSYRDWSVRDILPCEKRSFAVGYPAVQVPAESTRLARLKMLRGLSRLRKLRFGNGGLGLSYLREAKILLALCRSSAISNPPLSPQ
jgi:hypothetical protein